jgi:hypothetical protein
MLKTILLWCLAAFPLVYGVKVYAAAVALHDDRIMVIARCMTHKAKALDISSQEAYVLCEREER